MLAGIADTRHHSDNGGLAGNADDPNITVIMPMMITIIAITTNKEK